MGIVLMINLYLVIVVTDCDASGLPKPECTGILHYTLLIFFSVELSLRIWAFRLSFFTNSLSCFEFVIVSIDVLVEILQASGVDLMSFSVLRIVRLLRLLRAGRMLKANRELMVMLYGLAGTCKAVVWCLLLLMFAVTVWAIICVEFVSDFVGELVQEGVLDEQLFGTVYKASLTIFNTIVVGDNFGDVAVVIAQANPLTAPLFVLMVASVQMALLNLIIAAIVDRAAEAQRVEREAEDLRKRSDYQTLKKEVRSIFRDMDADQTGTVSLQELIDCYTKNESLRLIFDQMDFDVEDLRMVYRRMDSDKSGDIQFKEFVDQLWKIKNMDSRMMLTFIRHELKEVQRITRDERKEVHQMNRKAEGERQLFEDLTNEVQKDTRRIVQQVAQLEASGTQYFGDAPALARGLTPPPVIDVFSPKAKQEPLTPPGAAAAAAAAEANAADASELRLTSLNGNVCASADGALTTPRLSAAEAVHGQSCIITSLDAVEAKRKDAPQQKMPTYERFASKEAI